MKKIQPVSSRWTFFLKLAFPLLWIIIMGGVTVLMLISPLENIKEPFSPSTAKAMMIGFYLTVIGLLYLLFMRTHWVGLDTKNIYVSNFFKSYKYTYNSIAKFEEKNMLLYTIVVIHFHQKTKFGKSIYFIRNHYWNYFLEKHPEVIDEIFAEVSEDQKQVTETKEGE
jgi:hypothetical protein